jgi:hypothetical protein
MCFQLFRDFTKMNKSPLEIVNNAVVEELVCGNIGKG